LLLTAAMYLVSLSSALGQTSWLLEGTTAQHSGMSGTSICEEGAASSPLRDAFRQACLRKRPALPDSAIPETIIIGFVGGFVRRDNAKHPEVQFAAYLRNRYPSAIHAEVFSNHDGQKAFRQVLRLIARDHNGAPTATEKSRARIIIYGHSWGASETVSFATELGENDIPVLLTIQVDTIAKPGQSGSMIPSNVASAVNFYQPRGLLHGRSGIYAVDPARTKIIGNFRMTYEHPINCDNYPWYARTFNRPHHEIENDPRVWDQAASLIDAELSSPGSRADSSPSQSALLK
jgi:hypothetical protein